jgi:hypothetical protein
MSRLGNANRDRPLLVIRAADNLMQFALIPVVCSSFCVRRHAGGLYIVCSMSQLGNFRSVTAAIMH